MESTCRNPFQVKAFLIFLSNLLFFCRDTHNNRQGIMEFEHGSHGHPQVTQLSLTVFNYHDKSRPSHILDVADYNSNRSSPKPNNSGNGRVIVQC